MTASARRWPTARRPRSPPPSRGSGRKMRPRLRARLTGDIYERMTEPWSRTPPALSEAKRAEIRALAEKADQLVEASLSENTRIAYGKAWRAWSEWCLGFGLDPTGEDAAAAADARWLVTHLTALSETALAVDHPAAPRRGRRDPQAAEAAARARRRRVRGLRSAACAGPRVRGRCARRRCSSRTCAPPPWC